jgi:anti-sigma factor RsiW
MITHDDDHFDTVALLALGVLPAAEAEVLAKHIATCADCRMVYASLRMSADLVGYQEEALGEKLDEVSRFRLKTRVLKSIRSADAVDTMVASSNGRATSAHADVAVRRRYLSWGLAAAAIMIAAIDTISNTSLRAENDRLSTIASQQGSVAEANATQARELDRRLAEIVAPGAKRFSIPQGEIVAANGRMIIALRNLPALPAGKKYQAWTRKRGAQKMTPGALFSPDSSGIAFVDVPMPAKTIAAVAVSVEPATGSKAPTSKPTFVRSLG